MGHLGKDVFPYGLSFGEDSLAPMFTFYGKTGPNTHTNREVLTFFDPRKDALPYIYDNFNWPHCSELGYDLHDLLPENG